MNTIGEWLTAVLCIAIVLGFFLMTGTLVLAAVVGIILLFIGAVFIDVLLAPFRWVSSLFRSTKENGKREED